MVDFLGPWRWLEVSERFLDERREQVVNTYRHPIHQHWPDLLVNWARLVWSVQSSRLERLCHLRGMYLRSTHRWPRHPCVRIWDQDLRMLIKCMSSRCATQSGHPPGVPQTELRPRSYGQAACVCVWNRVPCIQRSTRRRRKWPSVTAFSCQLRVITRSLRLIVPIGSSYCGRVARYPFMKFAGPRDVWIRCKGRSRAVRKQ